MPNPNSNPNPLHYQFRNVGIAVVGIYLPGFVDIGARVRVSVRVSVSVR